LRLAAVEAFPAKAGMIRPLVARINPVYRDPQDSVLFLPPYEYFPVHTPFTDNSNEPVAFRRQKTDSS
jgi:hypothetical protein